ncbi:hypothetical protein L1049_022882 [Liquidambar formosana]|uniref:Histidine-containing phosphotransfer protein n=1 Tax=Liquidambar formosana TaxID=63359 RepID=A0AAP0REM3_LIQFO
MRLLLLKQLIISHIYYCIDVLLFHNLAFGYQLMHAYTRVRLDKFFRLYKPPFGSYSAEALKPSITLVVYWSSIMSMESDPLRQQLASMRQALFDEFATLEFLETKDEPNFVEEVIGLFFRDSTKLFETIEKALEKTPFDPIMMDKYLHQFKGSSSR